MGLRCTSDLLMCQAKRLSLKEATCANGPGELSVCDNDSTIGKHHLGHSTAFKTFVRGIVHILVMCLGADLEGLFGIKEDQVSVAAHGQSTFLWEEAKKLCRSCGHEFYKSIQCQSLLEHSFVEEQHQPVLNARRTVGNGSEAVSAQILLPPEVKGTMVGGDHL
jgi:hypothetical protein